MIPNTELENGKIELIREILDIQDIHDIDLLSKFNREIYSSLLTTQNVNMNLESGNWE